MKLYLIIYLKWTTLKCQKLFIFETQYSLVSIFNIWNSANSQGNCGKPVWTIFLTILMTLGYHSFTRLCIYTDAVGHMLRAKNGGKNVGTQNINEPNDPLLMGWIPAQMAMVCYFQYTLNRNLEFVFIVQCSSTGRWFRNDFPSLHA